MTVQTITQVVSKTRLYPPPDKAESDPTTPDQITTIPEEPDQITRDQITRSEDLPDLVLPDALKSTARQNLPPICWDDAIWRCGGYDLYASFIPSG